jgi:hypothetical protein
MRARPLHEFAAVMQQTFFLVAVSGKLTPLCDRIRCVQRSDRSTTTSLNWSTGAMSV